LRFIFADSLDQVDPGYDFLADRMHAGRKPYWDDVYPHELFADAPYDGVLISRGIVGDHRMKGKYSSSQAMRFSRVGAREFLRFNGKKFGTKDVFGDCGAFSYVTQEVPPYSSEEMVEFYEDGKFTHGCSVDHIIFDFDPNLRGLEGGSTEARRRFDLTLANAKTFLKAARASGTFTPVGVVQGWSPDSMGKAAFDLEKMGYDYLALGGMVPLKAPAIHACLKAVRRSISRKTRLHVLGFAKAEQIHEFSEYGITSFDSTSPLIRAFKDSKANYYVLGPRGRLDYYGAIRIPQALESAQLLAGVKQGRVRQEELSRLEGNALRLLRSFDKDQASLEDTLTAVAEYSAAFLKCGEKLEAEQAKALSKLREMARQTLRDRPWKSCECSVCRTIGVEVIIFRGNNRNRRRGFHNLQVFYKYVRSLNGVGA
jgi:hypothetical protein